MEKVLKKKLKDTERQYWKDYLTALPENKRPVRPRVEASYACDKDATDELLQLYLSGKKYAGSSIAEDYISQGEPLPQTGNFWIFLNSKDEPSLILRTERIVMNKFKDVPVEIAQAEGEGDLSLEHWKKVHKKIYTPSLQKWGVKTIDDATVVTEFFRVVYV